jgi:hypothetical protein
MVHEPGATRQIITQELTFTSDERAKLLRAMQRAVAILHPGERLTVRWANQPATMTDPVEGVQDA